MRSGYLAALAARTLGAAPLLRPATPARFEPDGPTGQFDMLELTEFVAPAPSDRVPAAELDTPVAHAQEPGLQRLLPPVDPDTAVPAEPVVTGSAPARLPASGEHVIARELDTAPMAISELARRVGSEPPPPEHLVAPTTTDDRTAARGQEHRAQRGPGPTSPLDGPDQRGAQPPVVVHIGRIDVRAADAVPRAPAPPRPPRVEAGRSLADHLLARDRELS